MNKKNQNVDASDGKKMRFSPKDYYVAFCHKHNFSVWKSAVFIALIIAIMFVVLLSVSTNVLTVKSRSIELGLKNIGELSTQAGYYTNVQVISDYREVFGVDIPFTQNKYIFSYDGIVKAGVNFSEIEVNVDDITKTIVVTLPEIKILSNEIDEESLEVYDETKNIFNPLKLDDINLAFVTLKERAQENAIENGILENAQVNAENLVKGFLQGMFDLSKYAVEFR